MKLSTLTLKQLYAQLGLYREKSKPWQHVMNEIEKRHQQPPDISNEPSLVECLSALST